MRTLVEHLATRRRPVLRWEDGEGAVLELTGPVLANWVHKSAGLLAELEVGPGTDLGIVDRTGLHWRALAGALAAWSLGATVRVLDPAAGEGPAGPWVALAHEDCAQEPITGSAEEVLVYAAAPLALTVEVPAGFTDFSAAVRSQPDQAALGETPTVRAGDAARTETWAPAKALQDAEAGGAAQETVLGSAPCTAEHWRQALTALLGGTLVLAPGPEA
ncbi:MULTISPECIES: TIGR03089 family protein [Brevibacterium]|uniref:TIGR03089 family protein n=1 Tax=Brevibacterium salitolerans TaxID=1403566 RepID=A0ABN2W9N8_9MICO|nr:TIGR03089 family protein [Brevibacterium sp.]